MKILKPLWPIAGIAFGLMIGTAIAQLVDNNNRVWRGTQEFNAPVTFNDSAPVTFNGATNLSGSITGPLLLDNGADSAPSYSWTGDPDTGFYHSGSSGVFYATINGALMHQFDVGGFRMYSGTFRAPDGTITLPTFQFGSDTDSGMYSSAGDGLAFSQGGNDLGDWYVATGTLTATQVRKLNATPVEVIAAPGAGSAIIVESVQWMLDWNANAYDDIGAGEDFYLSYVGTAVRANQDTDSVTGLNLAATADAYGFAARGTQTGSIIPADNTAVDVQILGGEVAAADLDANGDSPIHYLIRYRVIAVDLS